MSPLFNEEPQVLADPHQCRGRETVQAGLFRRLAAISVDVFVLYCMVTFLIGLLALAGIRLALEPAILVLGPLYGIGCLGLFSGRTLGKALWGVAVTGKDGGQPGWRQLLTREFIGKWLIVLWMPGVVGRLVFEAYWVPTAYDLLSVLPTVAVTLFYYLIFRRTWYDHLAGTMVLRRPATVIEIRNALHLLLCFALLGGGVKLIEWVSMGRLPSRTLLYSGMGSSGSYRDFLKTASLSSNDYIFQLFDRYDVVVLCERSHSEATQWDFIYEIVKDPRFSERVGHAFTELGQTGMQSHLDELMAAKNLSESELNDRVLFVMRNWSVWPRWHRVNFPTYLKRLYSLNQSLPPEKKIRHHFTDVAVNWPNLTQETMADHWRSLGRRDEAMAQVIIDGMKRLDAAGGKPAKALVVMNFRHAFDLTGASPGSPHYNTCEFLRDALKGRVANVRINEGLFWPVAGGVWDRAFAQNGNLPAGFDLAGSPFGKEPFDLFPWQPALRGRLKYQDVFTGFVFINPVSAQYGLEGIPGYYQGWETEMRRRAKLFGNDWVKTIEQEIALEQQGRVAVKTPPDVFAIESWVAMMIASFFAVGLVSGIAAFGFRKCVHAAVVAPTAMAPVANVPRIPPRLWLSFAGAIGLAVFIHELGHCLVAWSYGCPAVPTLAKEYLLHPLPAAAQNPMALGGVVGSIAALIGAGYWLFRRPDSLRSALFAGALTMPGFYVLRYFLAGRGHDGTEFQEAQAVLHLSYSGHTLDWLFLVLLVAATAFWFWRICPPLKFRLFLRLLGGALLGLVILVALQIGNNALFDPLLQR